MRNFQPALMLVVIIIFTHPLTLLCQDNSTNAATEHVYRIGSGVKPPRAIYSPMAEYTDKARREHQQGTVVIKMVVGTNGLPRDIRVDRSLSPDLDQVAIETAKKWKFAPATKDGKPVAAEIRVEMSFHLG